MMSLAPWTLFFLQLGGLMSLSALTDLDNRRRVKPQVVIRTSISETVVTNCLHIAHLKLKKRTNEMKTARANVLKNL